MSLVDLDNLKKNFIGEIVLPGEANYENASRSLFTEGSPSVVLFPSSAEDVVNSINFAKKNSLILTIRSGGHSVAGFANNNGGIVIDLLKINQVEVVDEDKQIIRIGTGARWGEVARQLQRHGLALSSGDTTTVGVGGLTLGAGIGWMVRKFGLTIDNLISAEVVTAQGKILQTSEKENPDLFWAIRGGGGNFGIVTNFEFKAQKIDQVYAGMIMFPRDDIGNLLKGWRDYMRDADENLTTMVNILPSFGGNPPGIMFNCCYAGDSEAEAMKALEPFKKLGKVVTETLKIKHYYEVLEEAHQPEGVKIIVKNVVMNNFSDEVIKAIEEAVVKKPDMILQIRGLGGAAKKVPEDATAFSYRNGEVLIVCPTFVPATASENQITEALKPWEKIAALGNGAYANFLSTATDKDIELIYPKQTYEKLAKIKKVYDPENLFNQNYNIKPAR